jgi:hypothetical protein
MQERGKMPSGVWNRFDFDEVAGARLRQQEHGEHHQDVGGSREKANGWSQANPGRKDTHQRGKECADSPAKVVTESLAGAAQRRGKKLSKKAANGTE